jgi:streptogramin lyase
MADLKVTGYSATDGYADNGITAVKLNTYGQNDGSVMFWVDYEEDGEKWYGWFNADWDVEYSDVELDPGEGVWFKSPNATIKLQSSGSVLNETLPVSLVAGSQLCPNPTPVVVTMADVAIEGYSETDGYADNGITAVKLNTYGQNDGSVMFWVDYEEDGEVWYGWYNADWDVEYSDVELEPGESVWLKSPSATLTVVWPKAI